MSHFVNKCKHGKVLGQCRCASRDKVVRRVACVPSCPPDAYVGKHVAEQSPVETPVEMIERLQRELSEGTR